MVTQRMEYGYIRRKEENVNLIKLFVRAIAIPNLKRKEELYNIRSKQETQKWLTRNIFL